MPSIFSVNFNDKCRPIGLKTVSIGLSAQVIVNLGV